MAKSADRMELKYIYLI